MTFRLTASWHSRACAPARELQAQFDLFQIRHETRFAGDRGGAEHRPTITRSRHPPVFRGPSVRSGLWQGCLQPRQVTIAFRHGIPVAAIEAQRAVAPLPAFDMAVSEAKGDA